MAKASSHFTLFKDKYAAWCHANDKTLINGAKIYTGSITADKINVADLFAQTINATGSISGLEFISEGNDWYGYPSNLNLNAGRLRFEAADGGVLPKFTSDVSAHQIILGYEDHGGYKSQLWMNGNQIEHKVLDGSGDSLTVFKSSADGVEINGKSERLLYNGVPLALYSDLIPVDPDEPIEVPVTSVNGKIGDVVLSASDVGARPNTWMPSANDVKADPSGTAASAVSGHNTNTEAHNDIRLLIQGLTTRLNALANSEDVDLDQMAEIVAYIKSNRTLIESVTSGKVSVSDIVNNLTTNVSNKPLSAAQGVVLKGLIDTLQTAVNKIKVPTKTSELTNDSNFMSATEVINKINERLADNIHWKFQIMDDMPEPETYEEGIVYLVPSVKEGEKNYFDEYVFVEGILEKLGSFSTEFNPANYYESTYVDQLLNELKLVLRSEMPSRTSQLYNDAGFVTAEDLETGEATWNALKGNILEPTETSITWDGDITGRENHPSFTSYYKVSDVVINIEDAVGDAYFTDLRGDQESVLGNVGTLAGPIDQGTYWVALYGVLCVHDEAAGCSPGLYFYKWEGGGGEPAMYVTEYVIREDKLKKKYLPDHTHEGLSVDMSQYFETVTEGDNTITWDGNTEGMTNSLGLGYLITEEVPSLEDLRKGGHFKTSKGYGVDFGSDGVINVEDIGIGTGGAMLMVNTDAVPFAFVAFVPNANVTIEFNGQAIPLTFEKAGVYFADGRLMGEDYYTESITFNGYTGFNKREVPKLKNEHLSILETVGGDTITWDGNTEGLENLMGTTYRVTDIVITENDIQNTFSFTMCNGDEKATFTVEKNNEENVYFEDGSIILAGYIFVVPNDNYTNEELGISSAKKGIYFLRLEEDGVVTIRVTSLTINGYAGFNKKEVIKEEYLPHIGGIIKTATFTVIGDLYNFIKNKRRRILKLNIYLQDVIFSCGDFEQDELDSEFIFGSSEIKYSTSDMHIQYTTATVSSDTLTLRTRTVAYKSDGTVSVTGGNADDMPLDNEAASLWGVTFDVLYAD